MPDDIEQFKAVLGVLDRIGILGDVVVIGGWAKLLYQEGKVIESPQFSSFRTQDIDLLLRRPPALKPRGDLTAELEAQGFRKRFNGDGSTFFESLDLDLEFLIPERSRGDDKPIRVEAIGVEAQSLRLVNDLLFDTIFVNYAGFKVNAPDPIRFCFHKLILSEERTRPEKRQNDLETALELGRALAESPAWAPQIQGRFKELFYKQQKKVLKIGQAQENPAVFGLVATRERAGMER